MLIAAQQTFDRRLTCVCASWPQADATAMLKGRRPSYRESLLAVRQRLEVTARPLWVSRNLMDFSCCCEASEADTMSNPGTAATHPELWCPPAGAVPVNDVDAGSGDRDLLAHDDNVRRLHGAGL